MLSERHIEGLVMSRGMYRVVKGLSYLAALVLVNGITWWVLNRNLDAGVYPMDADAIVIPMMGSIFLTLLVLPMTLFMAVFRVGDIWGWAGRGYGGLRFSARVSYGLMALLALLFSMVGAGSWSFAHHGLIAFSYLPFMTMLLGFIVVESRCYRARLRSVQVD
jgi:hypothetical protein